MLICANCKRLVNTSLPIPRELGLYFEFVDIFLCKECCEIEYSKAHRWGVYRCEVEVVRDVNILIDTEYLSKYKDIVPSVVLPKTQTIIFQPKDKLKDILLYIGVFDSELDAAEFSLGKEIVSGVSTMEVNGYRLHFFKPIE